MIHSLTDRPDWSTLYRLVHELIAGALQRNTFTPWELEFLLDLEKSGLRKSKRESVLREYLRAAHQCYANGVQNPPRFSVFLARVASGGG